MVLLWTGKGTQGWRAGAGGPEAQPIGNEAELSAGADVDVPSSSPRMNQPSAGPGLAKDGPRPRKHDATGLKGAILTLAPAIKRATPLTHCFTTQ